MLDFSDFFERLKRTRLAPHQAMLEKNIEAGLCPKRYGDLAEWMRFYAQLPDINADSFELLENVSVSTDTPLDAELNEQLEKALKGLAPWRKGPFQIFNTHIDTEWRSDWKWDRVKPHISPLKNRMVLDVGCGNGYHCWRMRGEGAAWVVGVDPSPRFSVQFAMIKRYLGDQSVDLLPLTLDTMPGDMAFFDSVFSMGVLYHRISPMEHIMQLRNCLKAKGELILETLVVEGELGHCLVPEGRYAKMRNVWFLPSIATLESWLQKCGFENIRCVDINQTTTEEQRATEWMNFQSLQDFLDPEDKTRTIEGHPAPLRAVIVANRK